MKVCECILHAQSSLRTPAHITSPVGLGEARLLTSPGSQRPKLATASPHGGSCLRHMAGRVP